MIIIQNSMVTGEHLVSLPSGQIIKVIVTGATTPNFIIYNQPSTTTPDPMMLFPSFLAPVREDPPPRYEIPPFKEEVPEKIGSVLLGFQTSQKSRRLSSDNIGCQNFRKI